MLSLLACGRTSDLPDLFDTGGILLEIDGSTRSLQLQTPLEQFIARQEIPLNFELGPGEDEASDSLRIVADMPSMSHGPTVVDLQMVGGSYQGSILFVMGGEWVLEFFSGESSAGRVTVYVSER